MNEEIKIDIDLAKLNWHFIRGNEDPNLQTINAYLNNDYTHESLKRIIQFIGDTEFSLHAPEEFVCRYLTQTDFCQLDEATFKTYQSTQVIPENIVFHDLLFVNFRYAEGSYFHIQTNAPLDEDHTIPCLALFNGNSLSYYILDAYYADFFE